MKILSPSGGSAFERALQDDVSRARRLVQIIAWAPVPPPTATGRYAKSALANHESYVKALQGESVWDAFSVANRYLRGIADAIHPHAYPWRPDSGGELLPDVGALRDGRELQDRAQ